MAFYHPIVQFQVIADAGMFQQIAAQACEVGDQSLY